MALNRLPNQVELNISASMFNPDTLSDVIFIENMAARLPAPEIICSLPRPSAANIPVNLLTNPGSISLWNMRYSQPPRLPAPLLNISLKTLKPFTLSSVISLSPIARNALEPFMISSSPLPSNANIFVKLIILP